MKYCGNCRSCGQTVWLDDAFGCPAHGTAGVSRVSLVDLPESGQTMVPCCECSAPLTLDAAATEVTCPYCGSHQAYGRHTSCLTPLALPDSRRSLLTRGKEYVPCLGCELRANYEQSLQCRSSAGEYAAFLQTRGHVRPRPSDDVEYRAVRMTLVGVGGAHMNPGDPCIVVFWSGGLYVQQGDQRVTYPYDSLRRLEIGGAGLRHSSLGLIGGGFGFEGAAKGILAASLINGLTSSSNIDTNLEIGVDDAEFLLHSGSITPQGLRHTLSGAFVRMRQQADGRRAASSSADNLDRIQKAFQLFQSGAIDLSEFERIKRQSIG